MESSYTREMTTGLKGWLALMVLIHHLYQFTGVFALSTAGYILYTFGRWAVAAFMFLSGFGLMSSYLEKKERYIRSFPVSRILSFYLSYLVFVFIYLVYDVLTKKDISAAALIGSFTYGETVVSFGWYLQLTLLLYIVFYLMFRFFSKGRAAAAFFLIFAALYFAVCIKIHYPDTRYTPVAAFGTGLLYAKLVKDGKLDKKLLPLRLITSLVIFLGATVFYVHLVYHKKELIQSEPAWMALFIAVWLVSDLCMNVFMMEAGSVIFAKLKPVVGGALPQFLGKRSMELYAMQGMILMICMPLVEKPLWYALLAACLLVAASLPLHMLITAIQKKCRRG